MRNKIPKIIFIVIISIGLISGLSSISFYMHMKSLYQYPFKVVDQIVADALNDENLSENILDEEEWLSFATESYFRKTRQRLNWQAFKGYVQKCTDNDHKNLMYPIGKSSYKILIDKYRNEFAQIDLYCFEYDKENGDHIGTESFNLLLEKVDSNWKVVGISNNKP